MASNNKPQRLGRGLNAIFDTEDLLLKNNTPQQKSNICEVDINNITPNTAQPRQVFNQELIEELAESIKALGVIQPITLRDSGDGKYIIISGERRYRASKLAGLERVPAYIRKVDDTTMLEMSLVENIQRENLNSIEVAFTLNRLIEECGVTQEKLSERVGKKRSTISNYIRLLKLPAEIQLSLNENIITMGHAKAIMSIEDNAQQIALLKQIVKSHLSVRQSEDLAKQIAENALITLPETSEKEEVTSQPANHIKLISCLESMLNQKISIKQNAKGKGKIVIDFKNEQEINEILSKLESLSELKN
ncbi:MAG: ParB/RepB/Spo0J family partition protein [Rikenellaceae bacterium]